MPDNIENDIQVGRNHVCESNLDRPEQITYNTDAWFGLPGGLNSFDPRPVISPIIEVLAKHKVPLHFVDEVFADVRNTLQMMIVQPRQKDKQP